MSNFKSRLQTLWPNSTWEDISDKINMSYMGLSKIFAKNGFPKAETLLLIQEKTGCNLNWLLTGQGEPYLNAASPKPVRAEEQPAQAPITDTLGCPVELNDFVFIPRYDVKAAAGAGESIDNNTPQFTMAFRSYWIKNYINTSPENLSVIEVTGDSMEGLLNERDTILVNHAKNQAGNGIYVLRIGNDLIVKRTQTLPNKRLLISSANEAYAPFELDLNDPGSDVQIIGKVEWLGRRI